jgi:hypothetical protein
MALRGEAHGGSLPLAPSRSERVRRSLGLRRHGRARRRERHSRWRWLAWLAGSLALLLGLLAALVVWLGHHLEQSWIKPRIIALVKAQTGLDIDYTGVDLSLLSGLRSDSLRVLTPPALSAGADTFLRVEGLELAWRPWALASGSIEAHSLHVGNIELVLVSDEHGRSTRSELFPPRPDPSPAPRSHLSQSLVKLPRFALGRLQIDAIRLRFVELNRGLPVRSAELEALGVLGSVHSGAQGLAGTELRVAGAPALQLVLREGERRRHVDLALALSAEALGSDALRLRARLDLTEQDLAPGWPRSAELLALDATLRFDAAAGRTSLELPELQALAGTISLATRSDIFDAGEPRVVTNGSAAVHLAAVDLAALPPAGLPRAALPAPLRGLSLGALDLELKARELSVQCLSGRCARVEGELDARGQLRALNYDDGAGRLLLSLATLEGAGLIEGGHGSFRARVEAAPVYHSPPLSAELGTLALALTGTSREIGGAQALDSEARLSMGSARARTSSGTLQLGATQLHARVSGLLSQLSEQLLPALNAELNIARIELAAAGRRTSVDDVSASALLRGVAAEPASASGLRGSAQLSLSAATLSVEQGARHARELSLAGLKAEAELKLARADLTGALALAALKAKSASLGGLELQFAADNPLAWAPDSRSPARSSLNLDGKIARVSAGGSRAAIEALRLFAERSEPDRYLLELDADAAAIQAGRRTLPGRLRSELRVETAPVAGKIALKAGLRGLTRADLDLDARLDRERGSVSYRATLAAEPLTPLATLATAALPEAARYLIAAKRLRASTNGELAGVLQSGPELVPVPVVRPLPRLRGKQAFSFELAGLDVRAPDRSLQIPGLAVDVESQHGEGGAGNAQTRVRLEGLSYEGHGTALRLKGLDHQLAAKFDRVPGQGLADLHSELTLASAAQSWLPGYPVSDLRWTTDLQLDRLLSAYLRQLAFDNPGGGTSLRAHGALELTARGGATSASRALVGREALSLEGQLQQELEPLARAGSTARSSGTFALPFRLESGGLLGYRLLATLEANQVSFLTKNQGLEVERLNARVPIVEEIALLPGGLVLGVDPRSSPLADARFFDVHPFLTGNDYVTADAIRVGSLPVLGPLAANLRIERTGFILEQLQVGYSGGQIVGQSRVAYRDGDPIVRLRLNATGLRSPKTGDIFDANATLNFEPVALTLDGKMQIVRASRSHVLDILNVLDPFRESANANRVRAALAVGYPKFVRFKLHDGTVDAKIELGGIAQLVRIGEIKAVPLGPLLQRYVAPTVAQLLPPRPERKPPVLTGSTANTSAEKSAARDP